MGEGERRAGMPKSRLPIGKLLAEFAIIFAGVTLSFMADDWRQAREDRRVESESLALILEDLAIDSVETADALLPLARSEREVAWLISRWDDAAIPQDSLRASLRRLLFSNIWERRDAAFRSLRDTNRLDLIEDDSLRVAIIDYFDNQQQATESWVDGTGQARDRLLETMYSFVRFPPGRDPGSNWPPSQDLTLSRPWAELRESSVLYNRILHLGYMSTLALGFVSTSADANNALKEAIEAYLGTE